MKEALSRSLALAGNELWNIERRQDSSQFCERLRESCLSNDSGE
jgi:hypothetical protein